MCSENTPDEGISASTEQLTTDEVQDPVVQACAVKLF